MSSPAAAVSKETGCVDLIVCGWNQAKEFALDYPLLMTIAAVAFTILGIALLVNGAVVAGVVSLAAASCFAAPLLAEYSHLLSICLASVHSMQEHVFTEKKCEGGRLYYHNDTPILEITSRDSKQAGFAQGYLTGKNIQEMWKKYIALALPIVAASFSGIEYFKSVLDQVTIPEEYRLEMEGLAEGYNAWLEEHEKERGLFFPSQRLTPSDVMAWHAFLDLAKATPQPCYLKHAVLGCSTIASKDDEKINVGRNLDWATLGIVGRNSLVVLRKIPGKPETAIISCAGGIGCLTGINKQGLVTVVNEAGWNFQEKGMPYNLWHRQILETCQTVGEVRELVAKTGCAGSHILTVADPREAAVFEMRLTEKVAFRERGLNEKGFFGVTNHFHDERNQPVRDGCFGWDTEGRMERLAETMSSESAMPPRIRLRQALINAQSKDTLQTILINPENREIMLNFNNSFAATGGLKLLPRELLFT